MSDISVSVSKNIINVTVTDLGIPEIIEISTPGQQGIQGPTGATGAPGQGVAVGGSTGQVLAKASNTNYDTTWISVSGTGDVVGPASSVDSQVALFNGTTGKLLKAASGSGVAELSSGVLSTTATTGTGNVVKAASPALTGTPTAPTASQGNNSTQLATTAYVDTGLGTKSATLNDTGSGESVIGNASTGKLKKLIAGTNITLTPATDSITIAATAGGTGDVVGPASSVDSQVALFDSTTGKLLKAASISGIASLSSGVLSAASTTGTGSVVLAGSPALTGNPTAPTQTQADNSTKIATTSYVDTGLATKEPTITAGTTSQYYRGDKTFQTLDKAAVGLGNVDNTSDANKPISTATQTALDNKQPLDSDLTDIAALSPSNDDILQRKSGAWTNRTPAQFKTDLALTKSDVGLGNVDNTSDADKPISTATQTALDLKAPLASPALTGTPTAPTATANDNSTKIATTAYVDSAVSAVSGINRNTGFMFMDDFLGSTVSTVSPWTSTTSGTGATYAQVATTAANRPGIGQVTTGTTATGRANLSLGALTTFPSGGVITFEALVNVPTLSTGSEEFVIHIGIGDLNTGIINTDGVYFVYERTSSDNWRIATAKAASRTITSTSVVVSAGTWVRLGYVINAAATSVEFFIDGVSVGTTTTNIPDTSSNLCGPLFGIFKSVGTTARTFQLDYFYVSQTFTTPR